MKARVPWLLARVGTVIIAAGVGAGTQAPPSFAGHWLLTSISPQRPAYDQFWFGTEVRVTQTETTLVITRVSPPPQREALFTFGAESHNEYVVNGQKVVRDSRATLSRDTLLISTDTTPPDGQRWLSNILRWSLDPDGTLVVGDTEICGKGECPSVVTTLKFTRRRERNGASDESASGVERASRGAGDPDDSNEVALAPHRAVSARPARADRPRAGCVFARRWRTETCPSV